MSRLVKVVVWDLDGTVWPGVALESAAPPVPFPAAVSALDTLAARGILVSVASRNPAEVGELVESLLPARFVAPQYGFGRKVDALRRIADELDVRLDALAFVDDDPMERADVERTLPEVLVLAPDEVPDALSWPELDPGPVTAAAAGRLESYRQRERRRAARAGFGGSEVDFLRWCALRATVRPATAADADRLVELARRTTQYNSTGADLPVGPAVVLELTDRFGADGLVGLAAVGPAAPTGSAPTVAPPNSRAASAPVDPAPAVLPAAGPAAGPPATSDGREWTVPLLAVSCRAGGRGAVPVLLAAVARSAAAAGATRLLVPCRLTERNVPVRLGLKQAGFTAASRDGDTAVYALPLADPPPYPDWITVDDHLTGVPA